MFIRQSYRPETTDGWQLDVTCFRDTQRFDPRKKPLLMIPGYAMNTFILSFHPSGLSMIEYLCRSGYEVWAANLRGQGNSKPMDRDKGTRRALLELARGMKYGFRELGLVDFPLVRDLVLAQTQTGARQVHAIGCSLGATIIYAYLAHHPAEHQIATMTAIGGPVRWDEVHPAVKLAASWPALIGMVPMRGTRRMARTVMPLVQRVPGALSIYMNTAQIDLGRINEMVQTVEDPNAHLNRQIARWVHNGDLIVDGVNVTDGLSQLKDMPILCIVANHDGIVPVATAQSICAIAADCPTQVIQVGDDHDHWYAHADLFVSQNAHQTVFAPMSHWLDAQPGVSLPA